LASIHRYIAVSAACLFSASAVAADNTDLRGKVDAIIRPLMAQQDIPGMAVGIAINGKSYVFNYGVASKEGNIPVQDATMFELGSISKTIAATLGSHARATGKLSLDDHPGKYMPQLKGTAIDKASLLHLATYTAGGLPQQFPDDLDDAGTVRYFQQWKPDAEPGMQRRYSNPSLALFGHLTAVAMKGDYADLTSKHVFAPLGFTGSHIRVPASAMPDYAWGYDSKNQPVRMNAEVMYGPIYGVVATAADVLRLVQANIDPGRLAGPTRRAIEGTHVGYFKVGPMVQGLGWEQYPYPLPLETLVAGNSPAMNAQPNPAQEIKPPQAARQNVLFSKTGGTRGFNSYVAFVPEKKIGVVILANKSYQMKARITAAYAILEQLSAQPAPAVQQK
jgi:beta-lactamase class C